MNQKEQDIVIGKLIAPFGVRGEVKVLTLTDFPERLDVGREVNLKLPGGERKAVKIKSSRTHKGGLVLKFDGIEDRDAVEALRGVEIVIDESELAELPEDRFYLFDIIGLKVLTDDGRELGEVEEILQGPNDVYITSTGVCIPALKDVVKKVDLEKGEMIIHPMPGLLAEE